MDKPKAPNVKPEDRRPMTVEERTLVLLQLRQQMQELHARLEFLKLMIRLGVR
ncbi:MAG: hypothetical protein JSW36_02830 [Burkholderiales bacterium]|nr:MAG: hypothetical protein JSW36_02830 [Burkholderiales bacterium]